MHALAPPAAAPLRRPHPPLPPRAGPSPLVHCPIGTFLLSLPRRCTPMDPQRPHPIPHSISCCPAAPAPASRRRRPPSSLPFLPRMLPPLPSALPPLPSALPPLPSALPPLPFLPRSCRESPATHLATPLEFSIRAQPVPVQMRKTAKTAMFTVPVNIIGSRAPGHTTGVRYVPSPVDAARAGAVACGRCGLRRR